MDFSLSESQLHWLKRIRDFIDAKVHPAVDAVRQEVADAGADRWRVFEGVEALKRAARAEGLWNLFLPPSPEHDEGEYHGAGLTNLDYALCAQEMAKVWFASEVFNCSAPDTGNMEVLHRYGSSAHGGGGVSEDFGLARSYASIRRLCLADGPDEVHNRAIARMEFKR